MSANHLESQITKDLVAELQRRVRIAFADIVALSPSNTVTVNIAFAGIAAALGAGAGAYDKARGHTKASDPLSVAEEILKAMRAREKAGGAP